MKTSIEHVSSRGNQSLKSAGISGRSIRRANLIDADGVWGTVHEVEGGCVRFVRVTRDDWKELSATTFDAACEKAAE
jgi:hypothetical protein